MKRKLKINIGELIFALDNNSRQINHYLDLETGEVISISDETSSALERILEQADPATQPDTEALIRQSNLQDWQQEEALLAWQIKSNYSRYLPVESDWNDEGYSDMEDFIPTVKDEHLQELLWVAIDGKGAFRRFKDVLLRYPGERGRWFTFKDGLMRQRAAEWLAEYDIELQNAKVIQETPNV